ncbi:MAG: heparinase II/III family protein, partial [Phycisphaeraceae bacterium JB051]
MIQVVLVILTVLSLWGGNALADESPRLPWLVRPAVTVDWVENLPDFPRVTGLDESSITTQINWDRGDLLPVTLYFDAAQFTKAKTLMATDPAFKAGWERLFGLTQTMMAEDGLGGLKNVKPETYVYKLGGRLLNLALYYRLTGDKQAGAFLKAITLDTAKRSADFWMHKALRRYPADYPYGQLETAILARGMAPAMIWGRDLFTDSEYQLISQSLRHKGLYPMLRYLQTHKRHNNFLPAIASGAMCAAIALDDPVAKQHALALLNDWGALLEDDGSYGEQIDYFNYAFVNFAKGQLALGKEHVLQLGKQLPQLAGTLQWQLAHYALNHKGYAVRVNFGDDDFHGGAPSRLTTQSLALMTGNGLGTWMLGHMHGNVPTDDAYAMIAKITLNGAPMPKAVAPDNLPTVMGYDTGIGIIRSGWTLDADTVIGLRSGAGGRTRYSHDMPNRNSLALMYHGEYQLVEPGRASYRSPMRKSYDLVTEHHNTVTIGGQIQPRDRKAQLLTAANFGNVDVLVSEAAQSYRAKPKHARRSVYYLRELDVLVVWDVVVLDEPKQVSVNWHFGNDDGQSTLTHSADHWQLTKPRTRLDGYLHANVPVNTTQREGIMHLDYSYYPGDKNEG